MQESVERVTPNVPYPELYAASSLNLRLLRDVLKSKSGVERGGTVTPIDLRRTSVKLTDQEILGAVSTHLEVSLGQEEAGGDTGNKEKLEAVFGNINIALSEANRYITNVLGLRAPTAEVHSAEDVVKLIRKTSLYKEKERKGLETHVGYCALISAAFAVFELQKEEAHTLAQELKYVEGCFFTQGASNDYHPLFFEPFEGDSGVGTAVVINGITPQCRASLITRDKKPESQITKFLMSPEATAAEALKDSIGLRLEVGKDRMEDVMERVLTYLHTNLEAIDIKIENRNMLDDTQLMEFKKQRLSHLAFADNVTVSNDANRRSADSYRVIKIRANIRIPPNVTSSREHMRPIEIQLTDRDNRNERKLSSYPIYELKKYITVMTRLFGGCSEARLLRQLNKISNADGYAESILKGLQDPKVGFLMRLPRTKGLYAATDVYRRWLEVDGLIENESIRTQLMHKVKE